MSRAICVAGSWKYHASAYAPLLAASAAKPASAVAMLRICLLPIISPWTFSSFLGDLARIAKVCGAQPQHFKTRERQDQPRPHQREADCDRERHNREQRERPGESRRRHGAISRVVVPDNQGAKVTQIAAPPQGMRLKIRTVFATEPAFSTMSERFQA